MRLSGFIILILMVGLVFAILGSITSDLSTQYPNVTVDSSWEDDYNYADEINNSVAGLKERFDIIADEEQGWFSRITAGITAVPVAIITVPAVIFETVAYAINIITEVGTAIGIPTFVINFAIVGLLILIVFGLASFWHRSKI